MADASCNLSEVIPEDFSLFCLLVCSPLASVYLHIHAWRSLHGTSSDGIMLHVTQFIYSKLIMETHQIHILIYTVFWELSKLKIASMFYGNMAVVLLFIASIKISF